MDTWLQALLAIITGVYSGIVVSKHAEFRGLREEAARILMSPLTAKQCSAELDIVCLSMKRLGHKKSSDKLREISKEYRSLADKASLAIGEPSIKLPDINEAVEMIDGRNKLRNRAFMLKPSYAFILRPWW
ncbi:hypothetical protein Q9247_16585 [Halomonas meridiana]|uniref:hypothetical protein n=1 Tax=Halomonadaceae TaxID=28256 RepID=UPI002555C0C1|nr:MULTISPECIES: hypothetical protein [Halomonas]MDK9686215.1 hypothetical protein [Halomonas sp. LC1]MDP4559290.1 hypothetical protein [Halomonas meridiana]